MSDVILLAIGTAGSIRRTQGFVKYFFLHVHLCGGGQTMNSIPHILAHQGLVECRLVTSDSDVLNACSHFPEL